MESACKVHAKTQNDKSVNSISQSRNNGCCRSAKSPAEKIMFLQRTAGNQAVQRLIKSGVLQAKLSIGQPNDIYEQEADRVAEQVMRMPSICRKEDEERLHVKPICSQISSLVQREEVDPEEIEEDVGSVQRNEIGGNEGLRPTPRRVAASARVQGANALDCALERLTEAIHSMERNESIPNDVYFALRRFFPDESPDFLHLLRRRIEGVRSIIETVRIRYVFRPLPLFEPATSLDTTAFAINYILERGSPPAQALPLESPNFILVIPPFYRERNLQATRIVHECFHIYYPTIRHTPRERPRRNAFSYQGFVSMLGGLDQVAPLELFPEPGSECEEKEMSRQPNTEEELLQTKETIKQNAETTPDLESRINAIRGGGQPLAQSERAFYEPRFGYDFSQVRVHTDAQAAKTAQALNAQAFTLGHDIVFGRGRYIPDKTEGRRLLAHELIHVIQQGNVTEKQKPLSTNPEITSHVQAVRHNHDKNIDLATCAAFKREQLGPIERENSSTMKMRQSINRETKNYPLIQRRILIGASIDNQRVMGEQEISTFIQAVRDGTLSHGNQTHRTLLISQSQLTEDALQNMATASEEYIFANEAELVEELASRIMPLYLLGQFTPTQGQEWESVRLHNGGSTSFLRREVAEAFVRMQQAALQDRIELRLISATRTFDYQRNIWNRKMRFVRSRDPFGRFEAGIPPVSTNCAGILTPEDQAPEIVGWDTNRENHRRCWMALSEEERAHEILKASSAPGTSRHHWGTDIDLNSLEPEEWEESPLRETYVWLTSNAQRFGFHQPYTPRHERGNRGYFEEKWHWSYTAISQPLLREYMRLLFNPAVFRGALRGRNVRALSYIVSNYQEYVSSVARPPQEH